MHIPDGVLSPAVSVATGAISVGVVGFSLRKLNDSLADRTVPMTGMMAAVIFAGQMVNFPVGGTSGHLVGGVLASTVLGPWAGCLALAIVLIVQCLLFADGGIMALGANILHMGVIAGAGGYAMMSFIRTRFKDDRKGVLVGSILAAWLSVMAGAALFCVEFFLSQNGHGYDFRNLFTLMVSAHSVIGIGEALITGAAVAVILNQRPDLVYQPNRQATQFENFGRVLTVGIVLAYAIAAFLSPFASPLPDGYEGVAGQTGLDELETSSPILLDDYAIPTLEASGWQAISVGTSGILGVVCVLVITFVMTRAFGRQKLEDNAA